MKRKCKQIYIISCIEESVYKIKIGIAYDVHSRVKQLQTGNPNKLKIEWFEEKYNASKLESYLHSIYSEYRELGEWFVGLNVNKIRKEIIMFHS